MTEPELKQSGRDGVYHADLDTFTFVGEEPAQPPALEQIKTSWPLVLPEVTATTAPVIGEIK